MDVSILFYLFTICFRLGSGDIIYPDEEQPIAPDPKFTYLDLAKDVLTEIDNINKKLKDTFGTKRMDSEDDIAHAPSDLQYKTFDIKSCDCKCRCADTARSNLESKASSLRHTLQAAGKIIKNKIHVLTS